MANKIQIRRGRKADMPTGSSGEPLFALDTRELYIGTGSGNVNMGGSHWYNGTAISGTSTTANAYSYSACPEVKLDDIYLNTSNGNIYACTTAGKGSAVKWTYKGCIKGATGAKGADGVDGSDATVTVDSALSTTSSNPVRNSVVTKALNKRREFVSSGHLTLSSVEEGQCIVYEGEGVGKTIVSLHGNGNVRNPFSGKGTLIFRNMSVTVSVDGENTDDGSLDIQSCETSIVFDNCDVCDIYYSLDYRNGHEIYYGTGDVTFINSALHIRAIEESTCYSGIHKAGKVMFIGGKIEIDSGTRNTNGFDCNLLYDCDKYEFVGVDIVCTGVNNICLVRKSKNGGCINGGTIKLTNEKHSISHYETSGNPIDRFVGVSVSYYKTYMHFATVAGCIFNHMGTGSSTANQMILLCPTNMTGNHFIGSVAYIDGQNKKHIVEHNLSDNSINFVSGSMASGSQTTSNITY